ncbi:unnamed protein product [Cladocopium goreaui]|uniref:Probable sodium/metabolite cotransporter BASS4, chloroplastic (Bile acid transporter 4) (Bile acid-sodium symporter family protein 4) n=1 Tax=Cladocopium goreaui TaxID=2562237 RepID=A0A9P1FJ11_9DINO|nr:unnamed protein product [Cladocopium goreaui]
MAAKDFLIKNFLIIGLLAVITFGLVCPSPGESLDGIQIGTFRLPQVAVIVIFIVSGLCLDSISECLQYKALTLSIVLVLGVTPLLAWPILHFGHGYVEESLLQGLAVFCVVPTTLSSGVTMVTQAKGNVSLAVLLTTVTNLLGVGTMPWSVSKIFETTVPIKPSEMLFELIWLTLVPLIVGMLLREVIPAAKSFAKTNKKVLGLCQNSCILLVVLLMTSSAQPKIMSTDSADLWMALAIAAAIHLVYRVVGYVSATAAVLEPREWVTVVLMSSQKSLPVCVSVMSALPADLRRNSGLMIVPCIMAHASQLIIDSILAVRLAKIRLYASLCNGPNDPIVGSSFVQRYHLRIAQLGMAQPDNQQSCSEKNMPCDALRFGTCKKEDAIMKSFDKELPGKKMAAHRNEDTFNAYIDRLDVRCRGSSAITSVFLIGERRERDMGETWMEDHHKNAVKADVHEHIHSEPQEKSCCATWTAKTVDSPQHCFAEFHSAHFQGGSARKVLTFGSRQRAGRTEEDETCALLGAFTALHLSP